MKIARSMIGILVVLLLLGSMVLPSVALPGDTTSAALDILDPSIWVGSDAVSRIVTYTTSSGDALYVSAQGTEEETLSISAPFEEPLDFSSFRELALSLHISGSGDSSFTVSFLSEGVYYNASVRISGAGEQMVYVPIPQQAQGLVDALALTVTRLGNPISSFMVKSVSGDAGFSYAYVDLFMSAGFTSVSGTIEEQEDRVLVSTENGSAAFHPNYILDDELDGGAAVCLRIQSNHTSGTIAVQGVPGSAPLALVPGEHTYAFIIEDVSSELQYVFDGVAATQEDPIVVTGAAIYPTEASYSEGIGSITSCRSDKGEVTVRGTLSSDTVVEYIDGELALYIIPVWADEEAVLQEDPAATMSISTRFELSAIPQDLDVLCKYKVMILSGDEKISVAPSVFLNSGAAVSTSDSSVTGIHGTDTVGVFESNVTSVVLDVYADRLLETEDVYGALLYAVGTTHYYFDRSYIEELDLQIQFCRSSGTRVYLRFLTSEQDAFAYTSADQGSIMQMCALTTFLSERYQGIAGFIIGSHVNMEYGENLEDFASLTAVFSAIVQKESPGTAVAVPVCRAEGISQSDPALFLSRLSAALSRRGAGSVMVLYEIGSQPQDAVSEASHYMSLVSACGHACDGSMLFWQPDGESDMDISEVYENICLEAMQSGLRSVVLSVSHISVSSTLFEGIKEAIFENTSAQLLQKLAEKNSSETYLGTYSLWDFTASYDIGGWVSGGGFGRIISANAENGTGRVLQTTLEASDDEAGILLCWLDRPLDLTGDSVAFSFHLYEAGENVAISVVFGSGDSRAEYLLTPGQDSDFTVTCDLSDFSDASAVEYIAVILRGQQNAVLEVSKVEVCSKEKTEQQLQFLVEGMTQESDSENSVYYFIVVVLAAVTVMIFSILSRKNNRGKVPKNILYRK